MIKLTWMLLSVLIAFSANAGEVKFSHLKVKDKLFQDYPGPYEISSRDGSKVNLTSDKSQRSERGIKDNPLYKKLIKLVKEKLLDKANEITGETLAYNQNHSIGDTNFSGFHWSGFVAGAGIKAGRKLYHDYTEDDEEKRWVVEDTLLFEVDAQSFLNDQAEKRNIEISSETIKAFAGIRFRRSYTYIHYSPSYVKGLTKNFQKLFLGFLKFGGDRFLSLEDHESVTRTDYLSADVSASASTPSFYYLSAYAGGTLSYSSINNVSIHKPGVRDYPRGEESLRVGINKTKLQGKSAVVSLQAEFYKLLKISLLSYELSSSVTDSSYVSLSFQAGDEELLGNQDSILHQEVKDVLRGKLPRNNLDLMAYVISEQDTKRDNESKSSHLFLYDKFKGNSVSEVTLRNNSGTRYMFRYNQEKSTYKKTWIQALVHSNKIDKYKRRVTDTVTLEYEVQKEQRQLSIDEVKLDDPNAAYLRFSKEFNAPKTNGGLRKKLRAEAIAFGELYTNIDQRVWDNFKKGELKGNATVSVNAEVSGAGIASLAPHSKEYWREVTLWVCTRTTPADDPGRLSKIEKKCLKKLTNTFEAYKKVWDSEVKISALALKDLVEAIAEYAKGFEDLEMIFGVQNVGITGSFSAETYHGFPYVTYFVLGEDQGNGLIRDNLE
ncbi:MAG: hypothetical protein ACJARO_002251 [Bacteriovoracaceae bacterium]|jgi:hypothetical protein